VSVCKGTVKLRSAWVVLPRICFGETQMDCARRSLIVFEEMEGSYDTRE
jgi:hypothetical protein